MIWSSTQSLPWKRLLPSLGLLFQTSFRRQSTYNGSNRRHSTSTKRLLSMFQCYVDQQYTWQPRLSNRIFFSNTALSIDTELTICDEEHDSLEPDAVTSISRRRRPLRISSVPDRNIVRTGTDRIWNANLEKFRAFVQQKFPTTKGQAPRRIQPSDYPKNASLLNWLRRVRTEYQKKLRGQPNRLTERRIEQLRQLGFQFIETAHRNSWDIMFQQLCTYLREHGGRYPHEADLSTLSKEDMKLRIWCNRQRVLYKAYMGQQNETNYMNEKRIKALNSINFVWSVLESQWDEKYEELKQYIKAHGTTLVPARCVSNYSLGRWVDNQRRQYTLRNQNKRSSLTDERIRLLNEINFVWDTWEVRWMERYNDLVKYQRLNGQSTMPTNASDPSLRRWVLKQHKQYRKWINGDPSNMTAQRKELLDQLGMVWMPPT
jgi:Helicase associated domain